MPDHANGDCANPEDSYKPTDGFPNPRALLEPASQFVIQF